MTQSDSITWASPRTAVASAVAELRKRMDWTAEDLARECAQLGMPSLNRSVIANIESGRRKYISVDEMCCLAYALDVAPVHLLVPTGVNEPAPDYYACTPEVLMPAKDARQWIRGELAPPGSDPRRYFSNVPAEEFSPPQAADTERVASTSRMARRLEGRPAKPNDGAVSHGDD